MTKVDRTSMAVGLEAREPLLDHRLVEAAARIPSRLKLANGEGKRSSSRPSPTACRRTSWRVRSKGLRRPWEAGCVVLRDMAQASLLDSGVPGTELLDRAALVTVWEDHQSGRIDNTHHCGRR